MIETDIQLDDGRTLHIYDTGGNGSGNELVVFWHHGRPNIGAPPAPLFPASHELGIRWVSYDRPGYGESSPHPGRDVASAAEYAARVADMVGVDKFAVMGHSGGGPHALACAALLPGRVVAVVSGAGLAPYGAEGLDYFAGMADSGAASLRAAAQGREAKERYEDSATEDEPEFFTPADEKALAGDWSWLNEVVGPALEGDADGLIDDDLAYVGPWGFNPDQVTAPTLLMHGDQDRIVPSSHGQWLAQHCPQSELRLYPGDGHVSVLNHGTEALRWLRHIADKG